jgi:hypothetical protein
MRKRLLIAVLLLLLLAPFVFVAVVLYTEAGVRFIAARVSALERIGVTIEGVSGTLAGPLDPDELAARARRGRRAARRGPAAERAPAAVPAALSTR